MKQGLTKTRTKVRLLTDPKPTFMSIVDHGANQEPFRTIKSAKPVAAGDKQMPIKQRTPAKKDAVSDAEAVESGVVKVEFDKQDFPDKASVENWLSTHKWADYAIEDGAATFTAKSISDRKYEKVTPVDVEKGVIGFVGKGLILADNDEDDEDGDDGEDAETTTKTAAHERAIKLDFYDLYYTDETSPASAIADAMKSNPLPPGAEDIIFATQRAMMNTLKGDKSLAEKKDALKSVGAEMGDLMGRMYEVFAKVADDAEASKTEEAAKFVQRTQKELDAMEKGELGKAVEKTDTVQAPISEQSVVEKAAEKPGIDLSELSGMITKTVADAIKPVGAKLEALTKTVNEVQTTAKAAQEATAKVAGDFKAFKSEAPVRKSDGEVDLTAKGAKSLTEEEKAAKAESRRTLSSILGVG